MSFCMNVIFGIFNKLFVESFVLSTKYKMSKNSSIA